ncbi:MAG: ComEC/Rec2 family competence protein [Candidatus Pacebacteria bacterium]|nr:ComEC/Rec2 family competence protein [Candidatus Paceibacterota bacterium]
MHKADIFSVIALSYLGGIFFASFFIPRDWEIWMISCLLIPIALIGIFWDRKAVVVWSLAIIFSILGFSYYSINISRIISLDSPISSEEKVKIVGKVLRDYEGADNKKIVVGLERVGAEEMSGVNAIAYLDKYDQVGAGDRVEVMGIFERPENFSDFDYIGYLAKDEIYFVIRKADVHVIGKNDMPYFLSKLSILKDQVSGRMSADFIPSQSPVMQAMVLGESEKMSDDYKEQLSRTGLSHAIAISGSHFALIAVFLSAFFFSLGLWKNQVFLLSTLLISIYITLISFPASAVRAGIMIGLVYLAKGLGRQVQEWRILILAAFVMNIDNPLVLNHDLGFQLSFLAVLGLIYLSPIINDHLDRFFHNRFPLLQEILSATLAAQIAVTPFLLLVTNGLSLSAIFANILIIPIMPFCLGLGFIYSFVCFIPYMGKVISFLSFFLIEYLNRVISIFSFLPFSYLHLKIPLLSAFLFYIFLILLVIRNKNKKPMKILGNII